MENRIKSLLKKTALYSIYHKYDCYKIAKRNARKELYKRWVELPLLRGFAQIGNHCNIGQNSTLVPKNIYMEDYSRIQNQVNMISHRGKLIIKKYAAVSSGCTIVPGAHVPTVGLPQFLSTLHINDVDSTIVINEDSWIGTNSILLSHCSIGRGSVVAAGSVVTKPVPPYAVVAGNPAKIIACRFSIDQIIEHEKKLYPIEERMSRTDLEELFKSSFDGKRSIGTSEISDENKAILEKEKNRIGIKDYSQE